MPTEIKAMNCDNARNITTNRHSAIILTPEQFKKLQGNTLLINCNICSIYQLYLGGVVEAKIIGLQKVFFSEKHQKLIYRLHTSTKEFDVKIFNERVFDKNNFYTYNEWVYLAKHLDIINVVLLSTFLQKNRLSKDDNLNSAEIISTSLPSKLIN